MDSYISNNAIEYTIECLLNIAGLNLADIKIIGREVILGDAHIIFNVASKNEQKKLFGGDATYHWAPSFDKKINIPFFQSQQHPFAECGNNKLFINPDIITISFVLLSRYEETFTDRRDKYGRFRYVDSLVAKYGIINIPIVDEYAMLIRKYLQELYPNMDFNVRKANIVPTHDVDEIWRFKTLFRSMKSIMGGDLFLRKSLSISFNSIKELLKSKCKAEQDPCYIACTKLMELSKKYKFTSEFYFLGYNESEADCRYLISTPSVVQLMNILVHSGCKVGFHGGIDSFNSYKKYLDEKKRVESAFGAKIHYGRQHYLCFDVNNTPNIWDRASLKYDSTLGFFDHEGFRCGTCHPYFIYDIDNDCKLSVIERPLLLMDGTIVDYRKLSIKDALVFANIILDRVVAVGGDFVILWHNTSLERGMQKWYNEFYKVFLKNAASKIMER